jgi:uncharacterized protein RhaS with RHS repeats
VACSRSRSQWHCLSPRPHAPRPGGKTRRGGQYLRARYYDPATGQFISRDPAAIETRQAYGYTNGNPVNAVDPTGLILDGLRHWAEDRVNDAIDAVLPPAANAAAGFGDAATSLLHPLGLSTRDIRERLGINSVDYCSGWYGVGRLGGYAELAALGGAGAAAARGYSVEVRLYSWSKGRGVGVNVYKDGSRRGVEWHRWKQGGQYVNRPHYDRKNVRGKPNLRHWPW